MCMLSKIDLKKGEYFGWSCHLDYKQTMSRDFTNRVCFIFFSIITFSYRLLNALYVLPWLFGDKSVKSANIILSITILPSTVHARLACPLLSREVATLSSFICAESFFSIWIASITFKLSFDWVWWFDCLFSVQYLVYIYHYVKEWRKNPKWSFTCCLAFLLPLNALQGEIRGFTETNILNQQLQTGGIEMPSIGDT